MGTFTVDGPTPEIRRFRLEKQDDKITVTPGTNYNLYAALVIVAGNRTTNQGAYILFGYSNNSYSQAVTLQGANNISVEKLTNEPGFAIKNLSTIVTPVSILVLTDQLETLCTEYVPAAT